MPRKHRSRPARTGRLPKRPAARRSRPAYDSYDNIVVRFADGVSRPDVASICRAFGMPPAEFRETISELVRKGFLTPEPDGSYSATIPPELRDEL